MVFMLWGANALKKKSRIGKQHLVLESVHPSPLSAYRGFFGCKHFSKANAFLKANGYLPIDWGYVDEVEVPSDSYYVGTGKIKRV
jgi:uracil-DNA glycosylase